jgi:hypothetical protein
MHAVLGGILGGEEYFKIVGGLGLSDTLTKILVHGLLPIDGGVAVLLIFGNKISRSFPWCTLFVWAGVWPWVPRILEWKAGMEPEIIDAVFVSVMAALAYYLYKNKGVIFFKA